jgi:surfeit locus 1 family protein
VTALVSQRRGVVGPTLVALAAFLVLIGLGTWQLQRKTWKEGLIATLATHLAEAPTALPAPATWRDLAPDADEFRRVKFSGTLMNDREALVYTSGSSFRPDVSGPGYWVMTPARLSDGRVVMVDRGFVPEGRQDPASRAEGQVSGTMEIAGALRWPEPRGTFTPADQPAKNLWFVRDPQAIAAAKGLGQSNPGDVAPFFVEQETPPAPGGLPKAGPVQPRLPNNHLQYALTWYGLAAVLLGVFAFWLRGRRQAD